MGEVIYTKRYHFEKEVAELLAEADGEPLSVEEERRQRAVFEKALQEMEGCELVELPGAAERADRFISLAKRLCETCFVDMDIIRHETFVSVDLHLFTVPLDSEFTALFGQLVCLSDEMTAGENEKEPSDVTISLELLTHRPRIAGKTPN